MAYVLNGTIITQSGTDTNLSGLSSISGVTITDMGNGYKLYDIGSNSIYFTGTQNITSKEQLVTRHATNSMVNPTIKILGTLTLGQELTLQGNSFIDDHLYILCTGGTNSKSWDTHSIQVGNGGHYIQYGGSIVISNTFSAEVGSKVNTYGNVVFDFSVTNGNITRFQIETSDFITDINGTFITKSTTGKVAGIFGVGAKPELNNWSPRGHNLAITTLASNGNNEVILRGYKPSSTLYDWYIRSNNNGAEIHRIYFVDLLKSSDQLALTWATGYTNMRGRADIQKVFNPTFVTATGTVEEAIFFGRDTNNGSRNPNTSLGAGNYNTSSDITYTGTITNGVLDSEKLITTRIYPFRAITYRTQDNRLPVNWVVAGWKYQLLAGTITNHNKDVSDKLVLVDNNITENDRTIVQAYSTIANEKQLYDFAKSYKLDNLEINNLSDLIVKNNQGDCGSLDLDIASTHTNILELSGTELKIKSSGFSGRLETTGVIKMLPINLSDLEIKGTLQFNSDTDTTITLTNCNIDKIENIGTGVISIDLFDSTVTDSSDTEIVILEKTFDMKFSGALGGSRIFVADANKNEMHSYYLNSTSNVVLSTPRGYSGNLYYVVSKQGYTKIKGLIVVDTNSSTFTTISIDQKLLKDNDNISDMYQNNSTVNLSFALSGSNIVGSVRSDISAVTCYDELQDFLVQTDGCKWLIDNADPTRETVGGGKQQIKIGSNIKFQNASGAGNYKINAELIYQGSNFDMSLAGSVSDAGQVGLSADALMSFEVEQGFSLKNILRLLTAESCSKLNQSGSVVSIRDINDTRDLIVSNVDTKGNRLNFTYNLD